MDTLTGKVAVITGAASGIGRAVAIAAAAEGMKVVLADIEERALDETARSLAGDGADILAVVTDVSDGSSVEALRERALERFGAVHFLHNNAGVGGPGGPIWTASEPDWRWTLGVNVWGVIHGIRAFVPLFIAQGEGHVVNTASVAGLVSPPLFGPYSVSKHAVVAISEILYRDLRLMNVKVGASVLCPGHVRTRITQSERNRPPWAPPPLKTPLALQLRATADQRVADGIDPAVVADHVLDAVRANRFYILTHPELNVAVEARLNDILWQRPPTELADPTS
jgi:NAD(P)-dependent dehydrogenase (short-subunit alcohol dehydrogenase family)